MNPHASATSRAHGSFERFRAHVAPELPDRVLYAGAVGLFAIASWSFIEQHLRPACCDAQHYLELADAFVTNGVDGVPEALRTFAYPWILSTIQRGASFVNMPFKLSVFVVQLVIYYCAVLGISNHFRGTSARLRSTIYLLLCFNIFLIPYISLTLTDAIYTSISVWVLLLAMRMTLPGSDRGGLPGTGAALLLACVFLVSLAIVIRPAAIWLIGPLMYCLLTIAGRWGLRGFPRLMAILAAGAVPLYIQICINVLHFREVSFLPTNSLGKDQIVWGIENIKYATWLGGGPPQNYYSSAGLVDLSRDHSSLAWYFSNPVDASKLLLFKVVGAFDFEHLAPYPTAAPWSLWAPTLVSASLAWFGLCGVVFHLVTANIRSLGSRFVPAVFLLSWTAVTLPSAMELRFSLPMVCLFAVTASAFVHSAWKDGKYAIVGATVAWAALAPLYMAAASFLRDQSVLAASLQ